MALTDLSRIYYDNAFLPGWGEEDLAEDVACWFASVSKAVHGQLWRRVVVLLDRQRRKITPGRYDELSDDPDYCTVARTVVGDVVVWTHWIGMEHRGSEHTPLVFETGVLNGRLWRFNEYHADEAEARAGHERFCDRVRDEQARFAALVERHRESTRELLNDLDEYGVGIGLPDFVDTGSMSILVDLIRDIAGTGE
ncbi:MAG: hypothetical protein LBJ08_04175 [Bifidobacteriaceae bacterium]|nr:hypothetical protein [Bifidobacteriaceae bacterium]